MGQAGVTNPLRKRALVKGETKRRRVGIPMSLGKVT